MADSTGKNPGDAGYDASTDPNNAQFVAQASSTPTPTTSSTPTPASSVPTAKPQTAADTLASLQTSGANPVTAAEDAYFKEQAAKFPGQLKTLPDGRPIQYADDGKSYQIGVKQAASTIADQTINAWAADPKTQKGDTRVSNGKVYTADGAGHPVEGPSASEAKPTDIPKGPWDTRPGPNGSEWIPSPDQKDWVNQQRPFTGETDHTMSWGGSQYIARTDPATFRTSFFNKDKNTWSEDINQATGVPDPAAIKPITEDFNGIKIMSRFDPDTHKYVYLTGHSDKGEPQWDTDVSRAADVTSLLAGNSTTPFKAAVGQGQVSAAKLPGELTTQQADIQSAQSKAQSAAAQAQLDAAKAKQAIRGDLATKLDQYGQMIKHGNFTLDQGLQAMEQAVEESTGNYLKQNERAQVLHDFQANQLEQSKNMTDAANTFSQNVMKSADDAAQHGASAAGPWANDMMAAGPSIMKSFGGGPVTLTNPLTTLNVDPATGLSNNFLAQQKRYQPVGQNDIASIKALIGTTNPLTGQAYTPQDAVLAIAKKNGIDVSGATLGNVGTPDTSGTAGTEPGWGGVPGAVAQPPAPVTIPGAAQVFPAQQTG